MIKLPITPEIIEQAEIRAAKVGKLKNSIRNGEGNLVGAIGELLVENYIGVNKTDSYEYDLIFEGRTLDVKTKERNVPPLPEYSCMIPAYNTHQHCDCYVFVSILGDHTMGWIVGRITKARYLEEAKFYHKGDVDPTSPYGWVYKSDSYDLPISKLDTWP